ncbi:hypothetical protein E4T50_13692 [Aureobasidium sp. EXF-12298]|nr:hypothetical protein E4T50_13692 [Aureobasidium sp. EXF-12298]
MSEPRKGLPEMLPAKEHSSARHLRPGVYTPLPTFFNEDEELNLEEYEKHLVLPICAGSLGEAVHLSRDERITLIRCTRHTLDKQGFESVPIVAGVGGSSTRETIRLAQDAASAGAKDRTVGMVIPPAYYAATLQQNSSQIEQYYIDICKMSPANSSSSVQLSSKFCGPRPFHIVHKDNHGKFPESLRTKIDAMKRAELTVIRCPGRMDKLTRALSLCENGMKPDFLILDGVMHDLPSWKELGGHGTVSGISNIAPSSTIRLWDLCCIEDRSVEQDEELREVLDVLSEVDAVVMPLGVRGLSKYLVQDKGSYADFVEEHVLGYMHGYGRCPRRPLLALDESNGKLVIDLLAKLVILERRYQVFAVDY